MKRFTVSKVASHSSSSLFAHGVEAAAGTAEARDAEREEDEDGDPDDGGQEPAVEGAGRCRCVEDVARADVAVLENVAIAVTDAGRGLNHRVYSIIDAADGIIVALLDVVLGVPLTDSSGAVCDEACQGQGGHEKNTTLRHFQLSCFFFQSSAGEDDASLKTLSDVSSSRLVGIQSQLQVDTAHEIRVTHSDSNSNTVECFH